MKAIIVDSATSNIDGDGLRSELLKWAQSIGVDTVRATPRFVIARTPEGIAAHFSMKLQRDGHDYTLPNANRVAVDFGSVIVPVENDSWPSWFGEAVEVPEMPIPTLLETLAVADEAGSNMASAIWNRRNPPEAVAE
jgi:hypothetical protein